MQQGSTSLFYFPLPPIIINSSLDWYWGTGRNRNGDGVSNCLNQLWGLLWERKKDSGKIIEITVPERESRPLFSSFAQKLWILCFCRTRYSCVCKTYIDVLGKCWLDCLFTEQLFICAYCLPNPKHFININSLNPHNDLVRYSEDNIILSPFCRSGNWGSKGLRALSKLELPHLANKNIRCPHKLEFQNNEW